MLSKVQKENSVMTDTNERCWFESATACQHKSASYKGLSFKRSEHLLVEKGDARRTFFKVVNRVFGTGYGVQF